MKTSNSDWPVLIAEQGPLQGGRWQIARSMVVGRDSQCDIVIPDRQVSRQHARLKVQPDGLWLEDLNSKNGTHCNGNPVKQAVLLQDGDVVQIALAQRFVYLSSDSTLPLDEDAFPVVQGRLRLDKRARRVWVLEKELLPPLSVAQFRMLDILYTHNGQVVSRLDLTCGVWNVEDNTGISEQAFDALVRRLRDRLANIDPDYQYIVTVRGHGLRLDNPPI